jgi:hypothetical protein
MYTWKDFRFNDADVVNIDDWIPWGEYNPHNVRPWVIHDHGFVLAVVFAANEQDALDEAVDHDKLDRYLIKPGEGDWQDYMTSDPTEMAAGFDPEVPEHVDGGYVRWWWRYEPSFLGNASEAFDVDTLGIVAMPNPKMSFKAIVNGEFHG